MTADLEFNDSILRYDHSDDSIHLSSAIPAMGGEAIVVRIPQNHAQEPLLRKLLEDADIIPKGNIEGIPLVADFSKRDGNNDTFNNVPLGVTNHNKELLWNVNDVNTLGIYGNTGANKSSLLYPVLTHFSNHIAECELYGVDIHTGSLESYEKSEIFSSIERTLFQAHQLIMSISETMEKRYVELSELGLANYQQADNMKAIVLVIEEAWEFLDEIAVTEENPESSYSKQQKKRQEIQNAIINIARVGRSAGIILVVDSHLPPPDTLLGIHFLEISSKVVTGRTSNKTSQRIFCNNASSSLTPNYGRGYFEWDKQSVQFQAYISRDTI